MTARSQFINFCSILVCLYPAALISGPLIPEIILALVTIIFLFFVFYEKKYFYFNNYFFIFFAFFAFYISVISFFSVFPKLTILPSISYWRFGLFTLAIVFLLRENSNFKKYFYLCLLATMLFLFADALVQIHFGKDLFGIKNQISNRVSALFGSEYIMGSYIARLAPLGLIFFLDKTNKNIFYNFLLAVYLILYFFIIYYSGERSAFGLSIIFLFVFLTLTNFNLKLKIAVFVLALLLIFVATIKNNELKERMVGHTTDNLRWLSGAQQKDKKLNIFSPGHTAHYTTAAKMFMDKPILGHGVKSFRKVCRDKKFYVEINSCSTHPHNTYMQLLAETGLIGTSFVLTCLILVVFYLFKESKFYIFLFNKNKKVDNEKVILLTVIFINLFPLVPTGSFFNNWLSMVYFLPIGFYINKVIKF